MSGHAVRELPPHLNDLTGEVIGAAIEVRRVLGPGLLESAYEAALCVELELRQVPFVRQPMVALLYKDHPIGTGRMDLLVRGELIVELEAVEALGDVHTAQVLSYRRATGQRLGLLINFNVTVLKDGIRRIILS